MQKVIHTITGVRDSRLTQRITPLLFWGFCPSYLPQCIQPLYTSSKPLIRWLLLSRWNKTTVINRYKQDRQICKYVTGWRFMPYKCWLCCQSLTWGYCSVSPDTSRLHHTFGNILTTSTRRTTGRGWAEARAPQTWHTGLADTTVKRMCDFQRPPGKARGDALIASLSLAVLTRWYPAFPTCILKGWHLGRRGICHQKAEYNRTGFASCPGDVFR